MLRSAIGHGLRRRSSSSTTTTPAQQRPVVRQLLNAIRKTPWWAGGDVERNRTLFEELMERGNARCPHLGARTRRRRPIKVECASLRETARPRPRFVLCTAAVFCGQPARVSRSGRFVDSKSAGRVYGFIAEI